MIKSGLILSLYLMGFSALAEAPMTEAIAEPATTTITVHTGGFFSKDKTHSVVLHQDHNQIYEISPDGRRLLRPDLSPAGVMNYEPKLNGYAKARKIVVTQDRQGSEIRSTYEKSRDGWKLMGASTKTYPTDPGPVTMAKTFPLQDGSRATVMKADVGTTSRIEPNLQSVQVTRIRINKVPLNVDHRAQLEALKNQSQDDRDAMKNDALAAKAAGGVAESVP